MGGVKIKNFFPDAEIINLGCSGDGIQQLNIRRHMVIDVSARKLFIMCGVNNLGNERYASNLQNGYTELFDYYQDCAPGIKIYLLSILPVREPETIDKDRIVKANEILKSVASEYVSVEFIDLYSEYVDEIGYMPEEFVNSDGLHLNDAGYQKMCELIEKYINDSL